MKNVTQDDEEVYEKLEILGYKLINQFRFVLPKDIDTKNKWIYINITTGELNNYSIIFDDGETDNDSNNSYNKLINKIPDSDSNGWIKIVNLGENFE